MAPQKTVIVGGGPVGALAALYAARRGHDVEVYELRGDLRDPSTTPLNFTRSINLALSERGIRAIKDSGPYSLHGSSQNAELLEAVLKETIHMDGRMVHGKKPSGELLEQPQAYDVYGRSIFAVDRSGLNRAILDAAAAFPSVKFFFNHKLVGADFKQRKAWFKGPEHFLPAKKDIEVDFDLLIGADGAHSAVRYHMMKYTQMDYQQEYIDTLWCEFTIAAKPDDPRDPNAKWAISPNHLHIWPGQDFMFIAIPSTDGSFTCTLFHSASGVRKLEERPQDIPAFFDNHFPGVTNLIRPLDLKTQFIQNPHLPLISIKCSPHHVLDSGVILGDAAHAMVPFYGQGMNAGLEDVRVLFETFDRYTVRSPTPPQISASQKVALGYYSDFRTKDAHAINDLALDNYKEMRSSVTDPVYKFRKWLEETVNVYVPSLGWATKYSRVSFGNEPYSEVIRKSDRQGRILLQGLIGVPLVIAGGAAGFLHYKKYWGRK